MGEFIYTRGVKAFDCSAICNFITCSSSGKFTWYIQGAGAVKMRGLLNLLKQSSLVSLIFIQNQTIREKLIFSTVQVIFDLELWIVSHSVFKRKLKYNFDLILEFFWINYSFFLLSTYFYICSQTIVFHLQTFRSFILTWCQAEESDIKLGVGGGGVWKHERQFRKEAGLTMLPSGNVVALRCMTWHLPYTMFVSLAWLVPFTVPSCLDHT